MSSNLNTLFASRLYTLRRMANKKQPEIAEEVFNISQQAYSKLERGETNFSDEVIDAICNYFKISVEDFTRNDDKVNCINSPNSVTNNHNSQIDTAMSQILPSLLEELKSMRDERKFYMQNIERLISIVEKKGN